MTDIETMLIEAQRRFNALTPEQKREHRAAQRKSFVVGEFMMEYPEATREEAEEIYEKVVLGIGL